MLAFVSSIRQSLAGRYQAWRQRQQAYAELAALDDRSLVDIGITRSEIPYLLSRTRPERHETSHKPVGNGLKHA